MRNCLLLLLLFSMTGTLHAQLIPEDQVPALIRSTLAKKHPDARNLEWERAEPYYEAIFTLNKTHRAIKFDTQGRVAETEVGMPVSKIPAPIARYMKTHYPAERIQAAETVTKADGTKSYEIRITGMEVVFDNAGKFLEEEKD